MPRLYREAPLSIWEGSGNVAALDTLRAMTRQPGTVEAFLEELDQVAGPTTGWTTRSPASTSRSATDRIPGPPSVESMAWPSRAAYWSVTDTRRWPTRSARPGWILRGFSGWGRAYGTLPSGADTAAIVSRATPQILR